MSPHYWTDSQRYMYRIVAGCRMQFNSDESSAVMEVTQKSCQLVF